MNAGNTYSCRDDRRRLLVAAQSAFNGIDFLEVSDDPGLPEGQRHRSLSVTFVNPVAALPPLGPANFRVEGGDRVKDPSVVGVTPGADALTLVVAVAEAGDFSPYTLRIVQDSGNPDSPPPKEVDPPLSSVGFYFHAECRGGADCPTPPSCPAGAAPEPDIDYLAKDYASFRRLLIDRMASLMPGWLERNPADIRVVMAELFAYVGDSLSYRQDAIGTEAYLFTARRRASIRRHARLVDYFMHDGCNARAWVQFRVTADILGADAAATLPMGTKLLTSMPELGPTIARGPGQDDYPRVLDRGAEVFETMEGVAGFFALHNEMPFYSWGSGDCCLPRGATRATLRGTFPNLAAGMVLILQEVLGPDTLVEADADPAHRQAVRLTSVAPGPGGPALLDLLTGQAITEIAWDPLDAPPFPLCVSKGGLDVSMALGNVVLADHGSGIAPDVPFGRSRPALSARPDLLEQLEDLGAVPDSTLDYVAPGGACGCGPADPPGPVPVRYRPSLALGPLTQAATSTRGAHGPGAPAGAPVGQVIPYDNQAPAADAFRWEMRSVLPAVELVADLASPAWTPSRDLLGSGPFDTQFVAEVDELGIATQRFGDDRYGLRPKASTSFRANYRVGNGVRGNLGRGALRHVVTSSGDVASVTNPLPARGGVDPESNELVRQNAPYAFRTQRRAVTADDYARFAQSYPDPDAPQVQRAVATYRWTGSWRTVFLSVDRLGGLEVDRAFKDALRRFLEPYRMAGQDLEIEGPRYVPVELELCVRVKAEAFRGNVLAALLDAFSSAIRADGSKGVFHPDNFTFGQPVYLSVVYAAAQRVPGVDTVDVLKLQRLGAESDEALDSGKLEVHRLEVARLDGDPNDPGRGVLRIHVEGGK